MMFRGFWILCRSCLFPVRLPYEFPAIFVHDFKGKKASAVLACPACGHVRRYRRADLKTVSFRIPDPFRLKKAMLYAVDLGCANRHCQHTVRICAVAATTVSLARAQETSIRTFRDVAQARGGETRKPITSGLDRHRFASNISANRLLKAVRPVLATTGRRMGRFRRFQQQNCHWGLRSGPPLVASGVLQCGDKSPVEPRR